VDRVAASLSPWRYLKGWPEPIPNTDKVDADVAAAYARLYADDLPEAERRFSHMVDLAPNNVFIRVGLADVYQARGWPRLAEQELEIAHAQIPNNPGVEAAQAQGDLDLQDWRGAETKAADLLRRFPEDREMQELNRAWQDHNLWELHTSVERDFSSATNIAGGNALSVGAQLFSPPIAYNWRAYGGYRIAHQRQEEGNVTERLYDTGVEFRGIDLTASGEARLALFGPRRVGGQLAADWSLGDHWDVSGEGEIFATDTPIRALLHHITADAGTLNLAYRESESRDIKTSVQVMPFSDGNLRTTLSTHADQRVYTTPHLELNGTLELAASQNTSTDEPYYNPHHDALGAAGFDLTHILYRRYNFTYSQRLVASVGPYWEQSFGTGLAWTVQYEHQIKRHDTTELSIGLSFSRQPYDSQYQNTIAVTFNSILRF
jgi:biofilm PGA synthesis protein PgaA